jgi:hypothetical protein
MKAKYNIGEQVIVDGETGEITKIELPPSCGSQPYYHVRLHGFRSMELHAEEDVNSGRLLPVIQFLPDPPKVITLTNSQS